MDIVLWHKILNPYAMAVDELLLKLRNTKRSYQKRGEYCPIEHVTGRVKSITSILDKMQKKGIPFDKMEEEVEDIAGIRIICQFVEDIEKISEMLMRRNDLEIVQVKDYIRNHKESGYRSYHLVANYTVNTLDGPKQIYVEIQIRTMAMDFWATTEHSMQYKYKGRIPQKVANRLQTTAEAITVMDKEMSAVREEIMDAQMSSQLRYNLVEDIVTTIENLYQVTSRRQIEKIQEEFYRIYSEGDMDELIHYHDQLDLIAQSYKAQSFNGAGGMHTDED
ncbi:MAG: GTP pyrophosphokinase family protein [Eubacteriales bacterium]|nr:GTP pyrophosphokinase family protein [Eubacteriales bacterium]